MKYILKFTFIGDFELHSDAISEKEADTVANVIREGFKDGKNFVLNVPVNNEVCIIRGSQIATVTFKEVQE